MKNILEIKKGKKIFRKKILCEIIDINELYIILKRMDSGKTYKILENEFHKEYRDNFIVPYNHIPDFFSIDLNTLEENKRAKALRIFQYLSLFLKLNNRKTEDLSNIINQVANEISDTNPPCKATLYNWSKIYVIDGKIDFSNLLAKQIRISKINEEVEIIIKDSINTHYLTKEKISIRQLHRIINHQIWKKSITENKQIKEPSYETVRQFVNLVDKKTAVSHRYGNIEAIKQYKTYKQGINASRILEYVEIDHVFLDIEVNYEDINLGRPILTLLIDNYSLSILGLYIGFGKPNKTSVIQAIKSAILPKENIDDILIENNSSWFQFGIIENLIADNGKEFHSNDFKSVCLELGTNIQYAPPYHPWYKRYIENYFGVLNKKLISNLPGSYEVNGASYETLSYNTFIQILYTYIIDIYHNTYNKRKKGTPYKLWEESKKNNPVSVPYSYDEINIIMGSTLERSISKSGISIDNVYYNDENLNFIRRNSLNSFKVKIKRNWDDISYIYVFSDFSKKYMKVYAVDQEYTKNKTIFQHHCILKVASRDSKNESDREKVYSAVEKINEYLEISKKTNKRPKRKDKVLHYKNVSSSTFKKDKQNNNVNIMSDYDTTQDLEELIDDNDDWSVFNRD